MSRPIVKENKDRVIKMAIKDGLNCKRIAERLGCRSNSVSNWLNKWGYSWDSLNGVWVTSPS